MGKAAAWFGEKLGIKWLSRFGARAESQMVKSTAEIPLVCSTSLI